MSSLCVNIVYIIGILLTIAAIILTGLSISSENLFTVILSASYRNPPFKEISARYGIFQSNAKIEFVNQTIRSVSINSRKSPNDESLFFMVRHLIIITLVCGLLSLVIHCLVLMWVKLQRWFILLLDMTLLLISVLGSMICIALSETRMFELRRGFDDFLLSVVENLGFSVPKSGLNGKLPISVSIIGPNLGIWFQVAEDMCFLAALLCSIPKFISITEIEEEEKEMRNSAEYHLVYS